MAKARTLHRCTECGAASPTWVGRCATCGEWGTLVEEVEPAGATGGGARSRRGLGAAEPALPIGSLGPEGAVPRPTGVAELDRVLGGGLVPGSVTLLGGPPGIGKSTLLTQVAAAMARSGEPVLYVSAEESRHQVRLRAERLGAVDDRLWLTAETLLPDLLAQFDEVKPALVIVDSIQAVEDPEVGSAPGSTAQVRACAHRLVREAKERGVAVVLVGHVTKEGDLAGPRVLEHVVDTVLTFEGDRHHALRLLRAVKHRFGPAGELGLFELGERGLVGVPDAGALFLQDRQPQQPGTVVLAAMDGSRPLLVEVQALVTGTPFAYPKRSSEGIDQRRLEMVVAVLQARASVNLAKHDVFAVAAGGVQVDEPAADLAVSLAVWSAVQAVALPPNLVVCGEVGLGGELRSVVQAGRRLAEAARLGFTEAIVPPSAPEGPAGLRLHRPRTLQEAIARLR